MVSALFTSTNNYQTNIKIWCHCEVKIGLKTVFIGVQVKQIDGRTEKNEEKMNPILFKYSCTECDIFPRNSVKFGYILAH